MLDKKFILNVCLGIVLGGAVLFGIWRLYAVTSYNNRTINAVVDYINSINKQAQQAQQQAPAPTK